MAGLKFQKNCYYSDESETDDAEPELFSESDDGVFEEKTETFKPKAPQQIEIVRSSKRLETKQNKKQSEVITRHPTRVPNPKVTNRNALLARENRKRKKEMFESLQEEYDICQQENKRLKKSLKSRDNKISELEKERDYLKTVLANKSEIMQVLQAINKGRTSSTRSTAMQQTKKTIENAFTSYTPPHSTKSSSSPHSTFSDQFTDDYEFSDIPILSDTLISPLSEEYPMVLAEKVIEIEKTDEKSAAPGICVHINSGKVSIEFCPACHYNSLQNWQSPASD